MATTKLQDAQWRAIEAINALVECNESFEDLHLALERVRKHLEARIEQTRPQDSLALADLLGVWTE